MTAIAGLVTWFGISVTYLRFYAGLKAQGYDRSTLPYSSRFQPFAAWYVLVWTSVICVACLTLLFLRIVTLTTIIAERMDGVSKTSLGNGHFRDQLSSNGDVPAVVFQCEDILQAAHSESLRDGF